MFVFKAPQKWQNSVEQSAKTRNRGEKTQSSFVGFLSKSIRKNEVIGRFGRN